MQNPAGLKMEGEDIDALRAEWRDRIGDMSDAEIDEEIIGNTVPVILSDKETAQDFAERFLDSDEKKSAFRRLIDSILDFLKRAYDKLKNYKSWRTMKTLEGNIQAVQDIREVMFDALDELRNGDVVQRTDTQERMSIDYDVKNEPFVIVDRDILAGVAKKDWVQTIRNNLAQRFPNGVMVDGRQIDINRNSRMEMTYSRYMQWLWNNQPLVYADKLRATDNADEIVLASRNYVSEPLNHPRKDNIVAFARGDVQMRIGNNDYTANVVVGTYKNGRMALYDVIGLKLTKIVEKQKAQRNGQSKHSLREPLEVVAPSTNNVARDASDVKNSLRKNVSQDSEGHELSEGQEDYFAESAIRDKNGALQVMYHATDNEFTVFSREYLGENTDAWSEEAQATAHIGFWFNTHNLSQNGKALYARAEEVYLNVTNPYDAGSLDGLVQAITAVNEDGLEEPSEIGEKFRDWLEENGYDGVRLHDEEFGGTSVVALYPEQIKRTNNLNPTEDADIRYSVRDYGEVKDEFDGDGDVEQTHDLIAVHNLTADELMKTLELEGFPMPSIAVIRANAGHSRYGDISVIFDKATIDPAQSRRNKIYGADAWTPTFPDIEYEANPKNVDRISRRYHDIPAKVRSDAARPMYLLYTDAERLLAKYGGEKGLIEHYADDTDMMQAYLADTGKSPVATVQKQTATRLDADTIKLYDYLSDKLGKDTFSSLRPKDGGSPATARKAWFAEYGDAFKSAYAQYLTQTGLSETDAQSVINDQPMSFFTLTAIKVHHYLANGAEKITTEPDYEATEAAIRKAVDPKAYESWLHGLLDGIEKGRGVRNNKELFTNAGTRRSFKSLHYEVSLENIVRAMMEETEKGGATFPATGLFGLATKDYGSIDQVRADKSRLAQLDEYAYTRMKQEYQSRFSDIAESIMDKSTDNYFIAMDDATNALLEAVRRGKTQSGMRRVLSEYNHLNIQPDTTKQLYDLVQEIAQMPTEYFEAKPRRAVGLEEIAYVVLPDNSDAQLKTALYERNIPTLEYKAGDEADRARVLNGEETKSVRFSLRDTSSVDIATVEKENAQLREANEELRKQFQRTVGVQLDQKAIRKMARDLLKQYDSSYDVDTLTDNLSKVFDVVANGGLTWDEASSAVVDMCRKVLEESSSFDAELYEYDQPVREYLKNVRLEISDDMRGGIELVADNGAAYRRGLFGIVGTARNARLNGMRKTG